MLERQNTPSFRSRNARACPCATLLRDKFLLGFCLQSQASGQEAESSYDHVGSDVTLELASELPRHAYYNNGYHLMSFIQRHSISLRAEIKLTF